MTEKRLIIEDTFTLDPPPTASIPSPEPTEEEQADADAIVQRIMMRQRVHGGEET